MATPLHAKKWRIYTPYTLHRKKIQANCGLAVNPCVGGAYWPSRFPIVGNGDFDIKSGGVLICPIGLFRYRFVVVFWFRIIGDEFKEIFGTGPGRRQYFWYAECRWPPRLFIFWKPFAFIECRWVQAAAFCQSWTRHSMCTGKQVNRVPYLIMCHFSHPNFLLLQSTTFRKFYQTIQL